MSPHKRAKTFILRTTAPVAKLQLNRPLINRRQIRRIMEVEPTSEEDRYRLFFRVQPEETVCTFFLPTYLRGKSLRPIKVTAVKFDSDDVSMLDIILGVNDGDQD